MGEIIKLGQDEIELPTGPNAWRPPITLLYKPASEPRDLSYPERVKLDIEACLYHADRVQVFDPGTAELVRIVFPDETREITPALVRECGLGYRHVAGRIDMSLKLQALGVPFAWVYPEAGLHPAAQANLADVLIKLAL